MKTREMDLIQKTIDYKFRNRHLLQQAFVRRSYSEENGGENNEVLEFIGDKAIDLVVIKTMMKRFGQITNGDYREFKTKYQEGKFTDIKKDLVEGKMLARCIDKLGFNKYLILGKGDIKQNVQDEDSVKEDLFEAIVGAVAIDSNWNLDDIEEVVKMMLDFNDYFGNNRFDDEIDYVGEIQKWSQKNNDELPDYTFYESYNGFRCTLKLEGVYYNFNGEGKSKSGARYLAAKEAYEYLDDQDMLFNLKDEIGEADYDRAINQLQELYQKGYINEPVYSFEEEKDNNGNSIWICRCHIDGIECDFYNESSSKKEAKKDTAYEMLFFILEGYSPYEEADLEEDFD
jgi:ribonuclease-3